MSTFLQIVVVIFLVFFFRPWQYLCFQVVMTNTPSGSFCTDKQWRQQLALFHVIASVFNDS